MSTRQERIEVFNDTMDWIKTDPDLSSAVREAKKKTEIFYEDNYPSYTDYIKHDTEICVTGHRTFEAAMLLKQEDPQAKVAVMNFANAFHPGGGVTTGAGAQEECLCRCSTLYPLLYRHYLKDNFYDYHKELASPKATDTVVYTEGVVICKTDEDLPKRMPKEKWVSVDVMTVAAPDLRGFSNVHVPLEGKPLKMNTAELFGYHVRRAVHILTVAASKGADTLVLGAFGCGAFRNDPETVAKAYKTALEQFPKVFKKVEFAVYCPEGTTTPNYEAFHKVFTQTAFPFPFLTSPTARLDSKLYTSGKEV